MKLRFWRRPDTYAAVPSTHLVHIDRIPEIAVRHLIERRIPRPTRVTFKIMNDDGFLYTLMPMDLSYRETFEIEIPIARIMQDPTQPALRLSAYLEYDPKDRS